MSIFPADSMPADPAVRLDRARWLLPVVSAPIEDGVLATRAGRVLAAGPRRKVLARFQGTVHDHGEAAILPGLVNCHAHLELTPLAGQVFSSSSDFCGWLAALIDHKAARGIEDLREGVRQGLAQARAFGTALVADNISPQVAVFPGLYPDGQAVALVELLGFAAGRAEERWARAEAAARALQSAGVEAALAPHSPYTVSRALLERCARRGGRLSIHVAESREEVDFLRSGKDSAIRDLLVSRGAWDDGFEAPGGGSPVEYLDQLALLGGKTLAVHLVQATSADLEILARRGTRACLCPRSNLALGVGKAPLSAMLALGLAPCLGTDSLASSPDLNLFREAVAAVNLLGATPEVALKMATLWGAEALGRPDLGALVPGCQPQPLVVPVEAGREPCEAVLEAGARGEVEWLLGEE
ncbi:MAG: amidohydrolase family protein [Pseudomonadota bacterium]